MHKIIDFEHYYLEVIILIHKFAKSYKNKGINNNKPCAYEKIYSYRICNRLCFTIS